MSRRDLARRVVIVAAAIVFIGATVRRFHFLGGPYFEIPETIQDHVWPTPFPSRDAIVLSRRAEPLLPRGATVTIILPSEGPNYDQTHWLTGLGMLPRQHVVPQKLDLPPAQLPQFVITIHEPFEHPHYDLMQSFPEGHLYRRKP